VRPRRRVARRQAVSRSARRARWRRRTQAQKIASLARVRRCGSLRDPEHGAVLVMSSRPDGRTAGFEGLVTCGSVWACPVCAAKVAAARAEELAAVLDKPHEDGGSAFMLTLTIRHRAGDRLGLNGDDRARRAQLDQRRRWRNRLTKIDARRLAREDAEAMGWDVDEHQAEADEIEESTVRRDIARRDPEMTTVGPQAREQRESDTDELADLDSRRGSWDAVTEAWHAATSGRDRVAAQHATGLLGWARVTEATDGGTPAILAGLPVGHGYSGNGWHVHVHALLCFPADLSAEYVAAEVGAGMHARWAAKARALGSTPPRNTAGTCARLTAATPTTCTATWSSRPTRSRQGIARRASGAGAGLRCSCSRTQWRPTAWRTSLAGGSGKPPPRAAANWSGPGAPAACVRSPGSAPTAPTAPTRRSPRTTLSTGRSVSTCRWTRGPGCAPTTRARPARRR
jgi:hypothetical protein